jgi:hypothetical protein
VFELVGIRVNTITVNSGKDYSYNLKRKQHFASVESHTGVDKFLLGHQGPPHCPRLLHGLAASRTGFSVPFCEDDMSPFAPKLSSYFLPEPTERTSIQTYVHIYMHNVYAYHCYYKADRSTLRLYENTRGPVCAHSKQYCSANSIYSTYTSVYIYICTVCVCVCTFWWLLPRHLRRRVYCPVHNTVNL